MEEKKRIEYIDLAKGICIILVVLMHFVPEIGKKYAILTCLRMPLYYCLSGLFFKDYGKFKNFLLKKSDRLLIPFIAWYIISYGIYYLRVITIGHPEHVFHPADLFLDTEFYNGSIWFLLSLFWCNLLFFLINKITTNEIIRISFVIIIAAGGYLWSMADYNNFLYIGSSMMGLPFFYFGRTLFDYKIIFNSPSKRQDYITAFIAALVLTGIFIIQEETSHATFYLNKIDGGNPVQFYICGFCCITLALLFCKWIKKIPFVSFLGRFSIIVLLTHMLIHNIINRTFQHLTGIEGENTAFNLILFITVILSMGIIIPFCIKYLPYITSQKGFLEERFYTGSKESSTSTA